VTTATPVRAALVTQYGEPPVLGTRDLPHPGPGQCRVRVTAAPVVPLDLLCASGESYFGHPALPYVPGVQGVGVVERGDTLPDGTRVWFNTDAGMRPGDGSHAEAAVVAEAETVSVPDDVPDSLAAALGLSAVAAWMALTWRGALEPGEGVLVLGAGGVVGQVAVQAAVALGAGQVIAATRRTSARETALARGATSVVDLSGAGAVELAARMLAAADGNIHLVIDPVCGEAATAALQVLADGGRLVHLGASGGPIASFSSAAVRSKSLDVRGYTNNSLSTEQRAEALSRVFALAGAGHCDVKHHVVPLDHVADAWRLAAQGEERVVVVPTGTSDSATVPSEQP
jgi:NADPH:quinone reductase-like Zn-dependent oxidoreductase